VRVQLSIANGYTSPSVTAMEIKQEKLLSYQKKICPQRQAVNATPKEEGLLLAAEKEFFGNKAEGEVVL